MSSLSRKSSVSRSQLRHISPRLRQSFFGVEYHAAPLVHVAPGITGEPITRRFEPLELELECERQQPLPLTGLHPIVPPPSIVDGLWSDTGESREAASLRIRRVAYSWWFRDRIKGVVDLGKVFDVIDDGSPYFFVRLMEKFSGEQCMSPIEQPTGDAVADGAAVDVMISFCAECDIAPQYLPDPEAFKERDPTSVLKLVEGCLRRFCFFGGDPDDTDYEPYAELLNWAQRPLVAYGIVLHNLDESWHDGSALRALLHHYFPEKVTYRFEHDVDVTDNWTRVLETVNVVFGMRLFLNSCDCTKLCEHTMVVLLSIVYGCITGERPLAQLEHELEQSSDFVCTGGLQSGGTESDYTTPMESKDRATDEVAVSDEQPPVGTHSVFLEAEHNSCTMRAPFSSTPEDLTVPIPARFASPAPDPASRSGSGDLSILDRGDSSTTRVEHHSLGVSSSENSAAHEVGNPSSALRSASRRAQSDALSRVGLADSSIFERRALSSALTTRPLGTPLNAPIRRTSSADSLHGRTSQLPTLTGSDHRRRRRNSTDPLLCDLRSSVLQVKRDDRTDASASGIRSTTPCLTNAHFTGREAESKLNVPSSSEFDSSSEVSANRLQKRNAVKIRSQSQKMSILTAIQKTYEKLSSFKLFG